MFCNDKSFIAIPRLQKLCQELRSVGEGLACCLDQEIRTRFKLQDQCQDTSRK